MHDLKIVKQGRSTKIFLDENAIEDVTDYKIESSASGRAELTIKVLVNYPVEN